MSLDRSILESPVPPITQAEIASRSQFLSKSHSDLVDERLIQKYGRKAESLDSDNVLDACINLAVRLVFMLDVGDFPNAFSGRKKLVWTSGTIQDFMQETFPERLGLNHDGVKLGKGFDVSNIVRIAGFKVELTANLADHLRLRDADKTVKIFHHASFLKCQQGSPFFPNDHPSAARRLDEYNYWHDRLVVLKEEFDESRPSTLSQWWNDRREGAQWYTFWVAVFLTLLFGLFQSIVGAMQLYKAYYS
ncbi:hypothetical protein BDW74DRAFT_169809 [Aspergillus multicolor]|uniref:uncharacterized protein n=1 Tax=Aspergillus multicolor TaxID=41759 RepID=UPI003CCD9A38